MGKGRTHESFLVEALFMGKGKTHGSFLVEDFLAEVFMGVILVVRVWVSGRQFEKSLVVRIIRTLA
jgi:hypothetical protein